MRKRTPKGSRHTYEMIGTSTLEVDEGTMYLKIPCVTSGNILADLEVIVPAQLAVGLAEEMSGMGDAAMKHLKDTRDALDQVIGDAESEGDADTIPTTAKKDAPGKKAN